MESVEQINNYFAYSGSLSAGGQPTARQIELLKESGVDMIINISPVSAKNALHAEHALVESLKMDYVHFPVDCSNLRGVHYLTIKALLNAAEGRKVFMHCGGNIKTSCLIHMYHVREKGVDEGQSVNTLTGIHLPEDKWFAYFRKMGMEGLGQQEPK